MMMKRIFCFCIAMAVSGASALASVVSGSPQDIFLRSHPQQSSASEGITYQVPDDKLEPDKLYHDASKDGSRLVTRKRVVGCLGQGSAQDTKQTVLGNLKFDVTFRYVSTRENKGKGELTWIVNRLDINVNEKEIQSTLKMLGHISKELYEKAIEYETERTVTHENQHVMDAKNNPVWLYSISSGQNGDPNSLLYQSDRAMIEKLDSNLAKALDKQRTDLIVIAEARAVFASIQPASEQLATLLDIDKENLPDAQKYVPELFQEILKGIKESVIKVEDRMKKAGIVYENGAIDATMFNEECEKKLAEFTYANVLNALRGGNNLFNLAQAEVLNGSSAKIEIDEKESGYTYEKAYKTYYNSAAYNGYSSLHDSVGEKMSDMMDAYTQNIKKMYELIHAKLYEENEDIQSLADERSVTDPSAKGSTKRVIGLQMSCVEWLKAVASELKRKDGPECVKLSKLIMSRVHDQQCTTEETEQLRAEIWRSIGQLVKTGIFYDPPLSEINQDRWRLINHIIIDLRLSGLKSRSRGVTGLRTDKVKSEAHHRLVPSFDYDYYDRRRREMSENPNKWRTTNDYDYEMNRDKILRYCEEIYKKEADDIEKDAEEATERYKMLFRPAN